MKDNTQRTLDYWINLARQIAITAHEGQLRRGGNPYISHVMAVANNVEDKLKPIAWLHDVVEDTHVTLSDLKDQGFPLYITDAVDLLTHRKNETNLVYWNKILTNKDAVLVKIADVKNNLGDTPSENQKVKYQLALKLFSDAGYSV